MICSYIHMNLQFFLFYETHITISKKEKNPPKLPKNKKEPPQNPSTNCTIPKCPQTHGCLNLKEAQKKKKPEKKRATENSVNNELNRNFLQQKITTLSEETEVRIEASDFIPDETESIELESQQEESGNSKLPTKIHRKETQANIKKIL